MGERSPSRREVLRWSALALGAGAAGVTGCADDGTGSASHAATTVRSTTTVEPPRAHVSAKWWLNGNFAPVTAEVESTELSVVHGALPMELSGLYVRNGSNPATGDSTHWFFGDGMVHGVHLADGKATSYRNRYVRTPLYDAKATFGSGPPGGATNQSNVSVVHHAGRLISSGEVGLPFELRPDDLSTVGVLDFGGQLTSSFTAHPKIDPVTGLMHSFGYGFLPPYLTYHVTDTDGTMIHTEIVDVAGPTMIHDFAITERDAVFWELPVVFDLANATKWLSDPNSGAQPFVWKPDRGARIGIMPLGGPAQSITWHEIDPCYVFHGVNAYRDGDHVVLDVCRLSSMFDPAAPAGSFAGELSLRRWTVDTVSGRVTDDVVETHDPGELPSRDPRLVGRKHRYGYLVQSSQPTASVSFGGLIKHDYAHDRREKWIPHPAEHAGEWLFVPVGQGEDHGYLMSYLYDDRTDRSQLVVVDATDVAAGPVARVQLPQRVPYGFHATWVPA